jgi:hypothetical protein
MLDEQKIKNIFQNNDFVKKIVKVNSPKNMKNLLSEYGLSVSDLEVLNLKKLLTK